MIAMRLKKFFILSIALNLVFLCAFSWLLYRRGGIPYVRQKVGDLLMPHQKVKRQKIPKTRSRHHYLTFYTTLYHRIGYGSDDILFIGDSHIYLCPWAELFDNAKIKNRGIKGDTTDGVLDRISALSSLDIDKIFIMVGVNDIGNLYRENREIYENYNKLIQLIKKKSNRAKIFILSVLPVSNEFRDDEFINENVNILNRMIKNLKDLYKNVYYIDLYKNFLSKDDISLDKKYSYDGIHLNVKGYFYIKEVLQEYVS